MVRNYVKLTSFNKTLRHLKVWIQTRAHMFPTNSQLQQEEYIPLGCKAVSFICYLITALSSNVSITEDYWQVRF